ncbi:MAG: sodium:proton antiporter [Bacteroidia bacterium]
MSFFAGISIIITLSALLGYVNHRWLKLPTTIGVMVLSLVIGISLKGVDIFYPEFIAPIKKNLTAFDFSSFLLDTILCFMLFAGSLHVNLADLKKTWTTVVSYATIGVLISTLLIGFFSKWVLGIFGFEVDFIVCLLFGALISPTDPIAVIGILSNYNIPKKLKVEIVGESLFNDGVGVVVFTVIYSVMQLGVASFTFTNLFHAFALEVFGGLTIGLLVGYVGYLLIKSIDSYQNEVLISLAIVMGGYSLANSIHASGPLAMVVAGLLIGSKSKQKLMSDISTDYLNKFWELIDEICNTILFVLIGLEIFLVSIKGSYLILGAAFILLTLLVRFISLVPAYFIFNRKEKKKMLGLSILTWGGLRGGISIALALSLNGKVPYSDLFLVITFCIVLFSIVFQGLSIKWLLKKYETD